MTSCPLRSQGLLGVTSFETGDEIVLAELNGTFIVATHQDTLGRAYLVYAALPAWGCWLVFF